jgi:phage terminase large subunit-like protein
VISSKNITEQKANIFDNMAETGKIVTIGVDGSKYADFALECK